MSKRRLLVKELDDVYAALCANGLTHDVASFLTDLVGRVDKLECAERALVEPIGEGEG